MEDYREIGPPGNGKTRKTGASNLAADRETTRHVRIHASRVIFRGAHHIMPASPNIGLSGYGANTSGAGSKVDIRRFAADPILSYEYTA